MGETNEALGDNLSEDYEALPLNVPIVEPPKRGKAKAPVAERIKRTRILLEENDNIPPTGQFIGMNGQSFMLRPGEEAEVPPAVIEALNLAVMSVPVIDPITKRVVDWRNKLRFPYRILAKDV